MKLILVEAIDTFRSRYVIEVPDHIEDEVALDSVTCEEAEEFSSKHLGHQVVSHREITDEEMMHLHKEDADLFHPWNIETVKEVLVTPWRGKSDTRV